MAGKQTVLEALVFPLMDIFTKPKAKNLDKFMDLAADRLKKFSKSELEAGFTYIIDNRTKGSFPSISEMRKACFAISDRMKETDLSDRVIDRVETPERWEAWKQHFEKTGNEFQVRYMENHDRNQVAGKWPPNHKEKAA